MKQFLVWAGLLSAAANAANFPDAALDESKSAHSAKETIVLAGGCFWGVDAVFKNVKGVTNVVSGYSGGEKSTAQYEVVSTGRTGHAESVQVTYDPNEVTFGQLLKVYFAVAHDPTELNRQGPDTGTQYRSAIFYSNEEQKRISLAYIDQLEKAHVFPGKIVTQVAPMNAFYPAEDYHQNFLERNPNYPYIVYNDLPKLKALKQQFPQLCKR